MKYLRPAKVSGGISANPHLIIIKEVDHKNVTSIASNTAFKFDDEKVFIKIDLAIKIRCATIPFRPMTKSGEGI